jgi:hypothetical protein
MKNLLFGITAIASLLIIGCNRSENEFDASGTFEADETIVSSEMPARFCLTLIRLHFRTVVGTVDARLICSSSK